MTSPSLAELRDIHPPPPPPGAWMADAMAAFVLLAAVCAICAAAFWLRRFAKRRRLRAALRELRRLAADQRRDGDATALTRGVSRLLRRHAMARFPDAAACVDGEWLAFLDAHGGGGAFAGGPGAVLAWRPYRADGEIDAEALVALARRWLEANPA